MRKGVTLVELLIVIPIIVIVGAVVITMLYNYMMMYYANNDAAVASNRANLVLSLLDSPVHHVGLGVTTAASDDYYNAWGTDGPFIKDWDEDWENALYIEEDTNGYPNRMGVVYALPLGMKASTAVSGQATGLVIPLLNHDLPDIPLWSNSPTPDRSDKRYWISTPGTDLVVPMFVQLYSPTGTPPTLRVDIPGSMPADFAIPIHQDLYQMKAAWAWADASANPEGFNDYRFHLQQIYTDTLTGDHIEIEGIRAVRFIPSDNRRYLEVRVLAMGDTKGMPYAKSGAARLKDRWPELDLADDSQYYLEEFSVKWRLRDLGSRDED